MAELSSKRAKSNGVARMAVLIGAYAIVAGLMLGRPVHAAALNPSEQFVQQNIEKEHAILNDASLSDSMRRTQFRELLLSLTDTKRIGMFTLGRYLTGLSKADLDVFVTAFSDYTITIYESHLIKFKTQTLKVTGSTERAEDDVVVNAEIVNPNNPHAPAYKAAFRVRKNGDGHPILTDFEVEGVWLSINERSDFTAFLQQHDGRISELIADLKSRTVSLASGP